LGRAERVAAESCMSLAAIVERGQSACRFGGPAHRCQCNLRIAVVWSVGDPPRRPLYAAFDPEEEHQQCGEQDRRALVRCRSLLLAGRQVERSRLYLRYLYHIAARISLLNLVGFISGAAFVTSDGHARPSASSRARVNVRSRQEYPVMLTAQMMALSLQVSRYYSSADCFCLCLGLTRPTDIA
jgi:hypothetical protein